MLLTLNSPLIQYDAAIEDRIARIQSLIEAHPDLRAAYNPRWLALSLLEGDADLADRIHQTPGGAAVLAEVQQITAASHADLGEDLDTLIADRRYRFIADLVRETVSRPPSANFTRSDQIDRFATHPLLGIPLFLVLIWIVFQVTANVSGIFVDWVDTVITGPISRWAAALFGGIGLGGTWIESLVIDGVIAGAGGLLAFIPVLLFLYFFLALLEDSGYMARAAFVMDRSMQRVGLHGKSFLPLLVGFGCSVPGIYATRTLEDPRDRILTGLLVPFMSCAARLPVYVLIGAAFFGTHSGNLIFAMYLLGIFVAVLSGFLFRRTLFKLSEHPALVMELPPYRRPTWTVIRRQVWERTMGFVTHVWTIIMFASIVVWILLNLPRQDGRAPALQDSLFSDVSRTLAPAFAPAGFGTWEASGSIVTGLVAKEVVVSTMSQVYEVEEETASAGEEEPPTFVEDVQDIVVGFGTALLDTAKATISLLPGVNLMGDAGDDQNSALQAALRDHFTPLQAVAFSIFVLLYTPCMATVGALRHEFGTRWMWFSVAYMFGIAWLAAVIVYQIGSLFGLA
ncbi:MAG TPA: ferrous iron transport protein B [Aggregatilineaceae bacterium]|nr:ferrous iron transport protein B [Aggregatilineaceae bacterium]